jgi:hypothetical protein
MTNFESDLEAHTSDLAAGLLYALAGMEMQDALPRDQRGDGITRQRLYKVLGNMVWDWNWLSAGAGNGSVRLSRFPAFRWLPNRYGGLGVVSPCDNYTLPRWIGTIDFEHLPKCGPFGLWGIGYIPETDRFTFPDCISFEQETKANIEEIDRRYWRILASRYSQLAAEKDAIKILDALASCKTNTAAFHSLWVQLCFWRDGVTKVGQMLSNSSALFGCAAECKSLRKRLEEANGAAANFSRKIRYTRDRSEYLAKAESVFKTTELRNLCPALNQTETCRFAGYLGALSSWEDLIQPLDLLVRAYTRAVASSIHFGPATSEIDQDDVARATAACGRVLSAGDLPTAEVVARLGPEDRRSVGGLICHFARALEDKFAAEFHLPLLEHNRHCETFFAEWYPWA